MIIKNLSTVIQQISSRRHSLLPLAIIALASLAFAPPSAFASSFYEGKRLNFIVGGTPGAGLDAYVRFIARHMGKNVEGRPETIVQNMPGAGSMKAAEFMELQAARDGTYIGSVFPGAIMAPLLESVKPRFDPRKFQYLGTAEAGARICAMFHTSKIKTYEDAIRMKSILGASQSGGSSRDYTLMANALSKTQFQMVSGYQGGTDMFLAAERGEVEGLCGFDWSTIKTARGQWLRDKQINIIVQFGVSSDPELTQLGVPNFNQYVPAADRPLADLIVAQQVFSRMFFVPNGVPAERVALLREAFMKTLRDEEFLADATRAQLNIDPINGVEVQNVVERIFGASQDIVDRARKIIAPDR